MIKLFISADTTSLSKGADCIAAILSKTFNVTRTGSRGLFYLEPMAELEHEGKRHLFVNLDETKAQVLVQDLLSGGWEHNTCYAGPLDELPAFSQQQRLTFERCGQVDPGSVDSYRACGGLVGLQKALGHREGIIEEVLASGLRGRGGAAFPAGIKWRTVRDAQADQKYIVCNADEGDSGTYADRMIMEGDPMALLEGMVIAGLAVGATQGFIYLREEYPRVKYVLQEAIRALRDAGVLGDSVLDSGHAFDIEVRVGAWAYICGEETSLLNSLEGKRGEVRAKPPLPAIEGLFGCPTIVNNVLTLASVPTILEKGADYYASFGVGNSKGTMPFQLAGNLAHTALIEVPFGISLRELLFDWGGGSRSGKPLKAVQVGGPLGAYLSESQWDTLMTYEALADIGGVLGHGGIVAFDESVDMQQQARFAFEFCAHESCGKCTPCRIGSTRGVELIDKLAAGSDKHQTLNLIEDLCDTMLNTSLCAMGGMTPYPVMSAIKAFGDDFGVKDELVTWVGGEA